MVKEAGIAGLLALVRAEDGKDPCSSRNSLERLSYQRVLCHMKITNELNVMVLAIMTHRDAHRYSSKGDLAFAESRDFKVRFSTPTIKYFASASCLRTSF